MLYSKVYIDSFGYELAPNVVTSEDLEMRLEPLYEKLHLQKGQLEAITGIQERRFWDPGFKMHEGAIRAGQKAIEASGISPDSIDMLIYGGVCRDNLEPATACAVANGLGISHKAHIHDVSNACLGILNGMVHIANAIELGQIKAGIVVSCESARQIVDITIDRLVKTKDMDVFKKTIATLTGGSGAVAVLLTDESVSDKGHRFMGGVVRNATKHHELCRWGPDTGIPASGLHVMETDSIGVLQHGVVLGIETYKDFKKELSWPDDKPDKVICHQVGVTHQKTILESIGIAQGKDFTTFQYLGNIGTVSLPITAAIASEREFLLKNDLVGFLGIGSGLNCLMLGIEW
ncbi:MAG: 3-oxoacyl-ACP synthase III [Proteobacteria bacterium]|nr:3-oxoacyl-ACP synthase III [Desulfobacteraceae bacterium]MBU3980988.1 3-oxoacyl-ACP synthase III [Pseudomonadota bacterium]MBU4011956.1 3-oxoacyl-ACP synthase III [Pseudomonadota bacterium]MBU4067205.1 3-oxoacyl-ACP synthase III [Pseudomonadota bacterium]MBU4099875.1 3-oxoacyl-ACP synthase III [Pseudomonadota bacterium]